jgi:hypothetical protein
MLLAFARTLAYTALDAVQFKQATVVTAVLGVNIPSAVVVVPLNNAVSLPDFSAVSTGRIIFDFPQRFFRGFHPENEPVNPEEFQCADKIRDDCGYNRIRV